MKGRLIQFETVSLGQKPRQTNDEGDKPSDFKPLTVHSLQYSTTFNLLFTHQAIMDITFRKDTRHIPAITDLLTPNEAYEAYLN